MAWAHIRIDCGAAPAATPEARLQRAVGIDTMIGRRPSARVRPASPVPDPLLGEDASLEDVEIAAFDAAPEQSSRADATDPPLRPTGRRIAGNLGFLTVAEGLVRTLTLLTSVVVARWLGPTKLGEVSFAITLSVFFASIADAGLTLLTYRRIVARPEKLSRLVMDTTAVQVGLSLALVGVLIGAALVTPFDSAHRELLIVFSPYVVTQALNVIYAVQALERMGWVAVIKALTQLLTTIPTVALVVATHDPIWVAVGLTFGQLAGDLIIVGVLRRLYGFRPVVPDLSAAIPLLKDGRGLLGMLVLFNYTAAIDIITLSILRHPHEVGEYSAATGIVGTIGLLSQVLVTAVLPELVRRHAQDLGRFQEFVEKLIALVARFTLAGTAILVVESGAIVHLVYGSRYSATGSLLAILAVGLPLIWYAHILGYAQIAAGRQRDFVSALAIASATSTVAYPVLTAIWGPTGLAAGAILAAFTQAAVVAFKGRRHLLLATTTLGLRQLPYALLPIALIALLRLSGPTSLIAAIVLWLGGMFAVEAAARWPTARALAAIRAPRPSRG